MRKTMILPKFGIRPDMHQLKPILTIGVRKKFRGFSLVELCIVIVIISIIAGTGILGYTSLIERSKNHTALETLSGVAQAAQSSAIQSSKENITPLILAEAINAQKVKGENLVATGGVATNVNGAPVSVSYKISVTDLSKSGLAMLVDNGDCAVVLIKNLTKIKAWNLDSDQYNLCEANLALVE